MYEKEVVDQEAKIEKMKADKKDEYDIKKQVCSQTCLVSYVCQLLQFCQLLVNRLKFFRNPRIWYQIVKGDWRRLTLISKL